MEADLCQDFLQFVERLPSEIWETEQFGFAFLSELTDEADAFILQAVADECKSR